ncbi:hypothetical protein [Streptomyces sp. NPDC002845]
MTFGDQGTPYGPDGSYRQQYGPGPYDPHAAWAAEQERIRATRRTRRIQLAAGSAIGVALVAAVVAGPLIYAGDGNGGGEAPTPLAAGSGTGSPAAAPSVEVTLPSDAPSALPSLLARPVIRPEQAFPEESVRLEDGSVYERVDLATTTECAYAMSPELAALIEQGEPCARLTAALFTDAERRSQVTVTVLSFDRVEDASRVFAMASLDPVTYQVVSLDPPPQAGLPTVPPGAPGVFQRLMTVRSVVFAGGQWGDGAETGEEALTGQTTGLLQYVSDRVVAYEEGKGN